MKRMLDDKLITELSALAEKIKIENGDVLVNGVLIIGNSPIWEEDGYINVNKIGISGGSQAIVGADGNPLKMGTKLFKHDFYNENRKEYIVITNSSSELTPLSFVQKFKDGDIVSSQIYTSSDIWGSILGVFELEGVLYINYMQNSSVDENVLGTTFTYRNITEL